MYPVSTFTRLYGTGRMQTTESKYTWGLTLWIHGPSPFFWRTKQSSWIFKRMKLYTCCVSSVTHSSTLYIQLLSINFNKLIKQDARLWCIQTQVDLKIISENMCGYVTWRVVHTCAKVHFFPYPCYVVPDCYIFWVFNSWQGYSHIYTWPYIIYLKHKMRKKGAP